MNKWNIYEQNLESIRSTVSQLNPSLELQHQGSTWHTRQDVQRQVEKLKQAKSILEASKLQLLEKLAQLKQESEIDDLKAVQGTSEGHPDKNSDSPINLGAIATVVGLGVLGLIAVNSKK
jgi:hypothetical protein